MPVRWDVATLLATVKVSGMSRRGIAVGIGLLATSLGSQVLGQQPSGNGYVQPPVQQAQPQPQPVATMVGFQHHAHSYNPAQGYGQPMNVGCGNPGCTTCGGNYGQTVEQPSAFWTNYYRNVRWPMPFRAQDVSSVTSYFDIQRENGWRMHNTLGHAMFDQKNCLTQAGKNHIQSILQDNPANRKIVFVLQGSNQQQTSARVQSTELAISEMLPVGDLPPVYVTDRDAPGSSGTYQSAIVQAMMTSVPTPRLNTGSSSGGSSSSGAPGSSGSSSSGK